MDILSQGLAGCIAAQSASKPSAIRWATLAGGIAGMAADIDFFIRSDTDPLLYLEYHRYFTHSLLFVPVGGLITAAVLWLLWRRRLGLRRLGWWRLYACTTLGYATSGLLDACTSYGTHLWWPFSATRVAWNAIAIVDPLFTLILLVGVVVAAVRRQPGAARIALVGALVYLGVGVLQRERAEATMTALAAQRGHQIQRFVVKPTLGNLLLWRAVYRTSDRYHVDGVRVGLEPKIYPGASVPIPRLDKVFPGLAPNSLLRQDIERFRHFADDFMALHPDRPEMLGDLRYAMLPDSARPLWGIIVDPTKAQDHARFVQLRQLDDATRQRFWAMLQGDGAQRVAAPKAPE